MPQVTIASVDITGTWDIIVDGVRVDTLSYSYPRTTITRNHDFVAYVRSDFYDRRDEYVIRSSQYSNSTVYLQQGINLGFREVSQEKANKENSRGCLGHIFKALIPGLIIIGFLILLAIGTSLSK